MATKTLQVAQSEGWAILRGLPDINIYLMKKGTSHAILANDDTWMPVGTAASSTKDALLAFLPVLVGVSIGMQMKGSSVETLFDSLP